MKKFKLKKEIMKQVTLTQRINYTTFNLGYATVDDVVKIIKEGNILMNDYEYGQYTLRQAIEYIRNLGTKRPKSRNGKRGFCPQWLTTACFRKWKGIILCSIPT